MPSPGTVGNDFRLKKSWIELVGMGGVIGSLIFVALEVRQNTAAVRGATCQAIVDASLSQIQWFAENDDIRRLRVQIVEGAQQADFTAEENLLITADYVMTVRRIENIFVQIREGLVPGEAVSRFRPAANYFEGKYFEGFWTEWRPSLEPSFAEYFEREFLGGR